MVAWWHSSVWKRGNRTSIFEKGNEEARSYRQVSLTSVPAKTMEQILQETLPRSCTWARTIPNTGTGRWSMDGGEGLEGIDGQEFNMPWPRAAPDTPCARGSSPSMGTGGCSEMIWGSSLWLYSYTTMTKYTKSRNECVSALLAYFWKWKQTPWWENMWQSMNFHLLKRGKTAPPALHGTSPGTMKSLVRG